MKGGSSKLHLKETNMAMGDEWYEWHLTPQGWIEGSFREDFRKETREVPTGTVMTIRHCNGLHYPPYSDIRGKYASDDIINKLIETYGQCPQ